MRMLYNHFILLFLLLLSSCFSHSKVKKREAIRLYREPGENFPFIPPSLPCPHPHYPWTEQEGLYPPITLEHFRCKGSQQNSCRQIEREGKAHLNLCDCSGGHTHSLPLLDDKEFIYPPLISILNFIQLELEAPLVITTGHRCPIHNRYCDASSYNWNSKHMIGAEVDFYVRGYERSPLKVIEKIQEYYSAYPENLKIFKRFHAEQLNTSTDGWFNEEIFIKLYLESEGRDLDNLHPYPYISIQVRTFNGQRVVFDEKAANFYLRDSPHM